LSRAGRENGWGEVLIQVDIREQDGTYLVEATLPGFKPEEITVTADEDLLTLSAKRVTEETTTQEHYVRRERAVGEVSRTVRLPSPVTVEGSTATYKHGMLTLTLPKAAAATTKQIPVRIKEPAGTS
jgi:HSP20 family protein